MTDLQAKFAEALRRELGMADGGAPGASVVTIRAPDVSITPRIVAELPALPQPLLVEDVGREPGAFVYKMSIKRDHSGLIVDATMTPEKFVPIGAFNAE
jgi:hypothetical protein